jgi:hypothetical protein
LYRRDRGCARPGCPETRIERLHAHHLRHWLFGGATDVSNMALLCDTDHGLAHDLDLVLHRRDGELIALTQDGRRVWGRPDAAFAGGLAPAGTSEDHLDDAYVGVHPIDQLRGRRPGVPAGTPAPTREPVTVAEKEPASISHLLFPDVEPELPAAMHVNGERMDLELVVWSLLTHRDSSSRGLLASSNA